MFEIRRRRRRRAGARAAVAVGTAVVLGGAAAVAVRRRSADADQRQPWACHCGQRYLVSGRDRHRVYWLADAVQADPLLARDCVACGEPLPAEHAAAT